MTIAPQWRDYPGSSDEQLTPEWWEHWPVRPGIADKGRSVATVTRPVQAVEVRKIHQGAGLSGAWRDDPRVPA